MSVIVLLIVAGGVVAAGFLAAFAWAVVTGQFDDTASPPLRLLMDDRDRDSLPTPKDTAHAPSRH